jgi:hypothetical protein
MIRPGCGTLAGALAHAMAGEDLCGFCTYIERAQALAAEGIPGRVTPPDETALRRMVLERELDEFERAHTNWNWRADAPRGNHLRAVP